MNKVNLTRLPALIAALCVAVSAITVSAAEEEIFFPSKKGMVTTTANFNAKGKLESHTRTTVKDVSVSGSNKTITYTVQSLDDKMQPRGEGEAIEYTITAVNGTVEYNLAPGMATPGGSSMEITGTKMLMPSKLAAGEMLPDANITMTMETGMIGKIVTDAAITGRKCVSIETITVGAGTFECWKVVGKMTAVTTSITKITMVSNNTTWYARGIGQVKMLDHDEKGKLRVSSELKELKR